MADFDFVVDTKPMAESVSSVTNNVKLTTAAVVAMEAAVLLAEKNAADRICDNVDKGFFSLIRSQVSMKLSTCYTEMQAKLSLLMEYSKTLGRTQERMEGDYNRVKGQYSQIFKGLDKALSNRIAQLDKDAVGISETRKRVILSMFERQIPETVVTSTEVELNDQKIVSSRIKNKTDHSLDVLAGKVRENLNYKQLMDDMLDRSTTEKRVDEYIPVVFANKQSTLVTDTYVLSLHYPQYLSEKVRNNIDLSILNQEELCTNAPKDDFERKNVSDEFQNLVATSGLDQRVATKMMYLFQQGGC